MGELVQEQKKHTAWDPNGSGYGKHAYRKIDPATVNPEDYAHSMRGEEKYYGDVREYNTGSNEKHPETDIDLYDLGLLTTIFNTDAEGYEGMWKVLGLFKVSAPKIWIQAARVAPVERDGVEGWEEQGPMLEIPAEVLGIVVGDDNLFRQVKTTLVHRGIIDRQQRRRLLTGQKTRDEMKSGSLHL